MSILWTSTDLKNALNQEVPQNIAASGFSLDTRTIKPGEIFLTLSGEHKGGEKYIDDAFEKGASAVITSSLHPRAIVVQDPQESMEKLAAFARVRAKAKFIGITGSVGKTGVTQGLKKLLKNFGETFGSLDKHNAKLGVPFTLINLPPHAGYGVLEIGMSSPGEIRTYTALARPHVAVITTVASAHLEFFENEEGIAAAKAEIFEGLENGGAAILPRDNRHYDFLRTQAEKYADHIITFGEHPESDIRLLSFSSGRCKAVIEGKKISYTLPVMGRHWGLNSLIFLGVAQALGLDPAKMTAGFKDLSVPPGRGQIQQLQGITIIDDSYNANPASMKAAIAVLGEYTGRKIAVLADMKELGKTAPELHAGLKHDLNHHKIDHVFTFGELMKNLNSDQHFEKIEDLLSFLQDFLKSGDTVLIKGSRSTFYDAGLVKKLIKILNS